MEIVHVPTRKKVRRESLRGLAGQAAHKLVTTCTGIGSFLETNAEVADILIHLTKPDALAILTHDSLVADFEMVLDFGTEIWDCVGVMVSIDYRSPSGRSRHAKAYIRIGTIWFDGDNELGYLKKLQKPPSRNMNLRILNSIAPDGEIAKASLFYKERRLVTERVGSACRHVRRSLNRGREE